MPHVDDLRTRVASQAASLSEAVGDGFATFKIGHGQYGVALQVPEGQSTGGGIKARQILQLVPRVSGFPVVVVGNVDPVSHSAELRGYAWVQAAHQARFHVPLAVTAEEYATFLKLGVALLNLAGIRAQVINTPPAELRSIPPPAAAAPKSASGAVVALAILAFLLVTATAFGVVFFVLRR